MIDECAWCAGHVFDHSPEQLRECLYELSCSLLDAVDPWAAVFADDVADFEPVRYSEDVDGPTYRELLA